MPTDIEKVEQAGVPALPYAPPLEIGNEDIALPRLKIGQPGTPQVQEELVKAGNLFVTTGDDAETVLDAKTAKQGLLVHVLSLTKRKSLSSDGELETWAFNDPEAPADAWTTYNYVVILPEVDDEVPHKWLLTRTATPAARQINTVLAKNAARGPAYASAFRITTVEKKKDQYRWFVPRVSVVEADPKHVEAAARLSEMVAGSIPEQSSGASPDDADAPAI